MKHVMLDLETLGNNSNAVIVSIGAIEFDPDAGLGREFYEVVEIGDCMRLGMQIDPDTLRWWMVKDASARGVFNTAGRRVDSVLLDFSAWYMPDQFIWGNGATFDNVILANAYRLSSLPKPWDRTKDRCYRTLKGFAPHIELERVGVFHNALDDAKSQALHACRLMKELNLL